MLHTGHVAHVATKCTEDFVIATGVAHSVREFCGGGLQVRWEEDSLGR